MTPWTAAQQTSLSITNSRSLLRLISIESVMPSNHLILCNLLLLLPSIFPSFRVFSNESVLRIRWPKYWSFSFSISPSNEYSESISYSIISVKAHLFQSCWVIESSSKTLKNSNPISSLLGLTLDFRKLLKEQGKISFFWVLTLLVVRQALEFLG